MKSNYTLFPEKPVILYEIYLPKKIEYYCKISNILNSFFEEKKFYRIPEIKSAFELSKSLSDEKMKECLKDIFRIISGYSIYEVDGRFQGKDKPIDERVLVIRFIIHDPDYEGKLRTKIIEMAKETIRFVITKRFAEETNIEDEIWFIEHKACVLQRWIKD